MTDTLPILDYGELLAHTLLFLAGVVGAVQLCRYVECRLDAENHALWRASLAASTPNLPDPCALYGAHAALVDTITLFQTRPALGRVSHARVAGICSSCATITQAVRAA